MWFFVEQFLGIDAGLFNSLSKFRDSLDPQTRVSLALNNLQIFFSLPLLFLINFLIFFGPLLMFGRHADEVGFEPGDADWGVKLDDVRGQAEPKEEVKRVITLWQSGEEFKKAGGKPERGLLFIGAPGTGKTMLSKAIATSFNAPIMTMPGSGFAATFIGIDVVIVMILIAQGAAAGPQVGRPVHRSSSTRSTPSAGAARRSGGMAGVGRRGRERPSRTTCSTARGAR